MGINACGNDSTRIRKVIEIKQEMSQKVRDIAERVKINSIIHDGKVTLEEAQSLGLNKEYDVSTEEGLDEFRTAYETLKEAKRLLEENGQSNQEFGLK